MVKRQTLFSIIYFCFLISRILVIIGVYNLEFDPTLLQYIYVSALFILQLAHPNGFVMNRKFNGACGIAMALLIHLILFSIVFVNPQLAPYTHVVFLRQSLFFLVVFATVYFILENDYIECFLKTSIMALGVVEIVFFALNISDVTQINILTFLSDELRSRISFGFLHYNTLGTICTCTIVLIVLVKEYYMLTKQYEFGVNLVSIIAYIMLLGSASRNSILGLIVFFVIRKYLVLKRKLTNKKLLALINLLVILIVGAAIVINIGSINTDALLQESNRFTLFDVALPTFFNSGRTVIGLGLAANEIYGLNQTIYKTYWLDNGFIYTLVTTGWLGLSIYVGVIIYIFRKLQLTVRHTSSGECFMAILGMYIFNSLFEASLFNGGMIPNYIFLPIFMIVSNDYFINKHNI